MGIEYLTLSHMQITIKGRVLNVLDCESSFFSTLLIILVYTIENINNSIIYIIMLFILIYYMHIYLHKKDI
jgi:hypothetical protein